MIEAGLKQLSFLTAKIDDRHLKVYALCRQPLLVPRGYHLGSLVPALWHSGGPLWRLRSALEDYGAAGWTRGGQEPGFH